MSAPSCVAVVGLQWGDEGKGKLVDWLAAKAQHVARFQGGNNAGHTLVIDGQRIILHLIPSGIMQPDTHCYIGPGVVLDCRELDEEIGRLAANKIAVAGRLAISPGCPLIMRHHIELDRVRETSNRIGTTLRGIGPAHEDRIARRAVRLRDVLAGRHAPLVAACVEHANRELVALGAAALDAGAVADEAAESAGRIAEHALDVAGALGSACRRGERILLEGSQGALLDIDQGTYPHVTSSNCIAAASAAGLGVDLRPEPFGIVKAYATRVGNGVFPTEISGAAAAALQAAGEEVGA
ncbi:MAG: adenylosuccinate synthetase, partial [Betaproteobacteria bacterium]|nr:adenylosuccinate synthetase [Betaproteobacteria bacterium]